MPHPRLYRGAITREQWLVRETRVVAQLMLDDGITDPEEIASYALEHNPFQYPTERNLKSIAKACARRIASISPDESISRRATELLAHGTTDQLLQTNLYALMCDNRLVWEFMVNLVAEKYRCMDLTLRPHEIAAFVEGLRAQSEAVDGWSDATRNRVRQALGSCITGCGIYDRRKGELAPFVIDCELAQIIRDNGDARAFAAWGLAE